MAAFEIAAALLVCAALAVGVLYLTKQTAPAAHRTTPPTMTTTVTANENSAQDGPGLAQHVANQAESADWLNDMLKVMWPYISQTVEEIAMTTVEPMLQEMLPGPLSKIKIVEMELGPQPITVQRVVVHSRDDSCIALDLDIDYDATPKIILKLPLASVGVKHIRLRGRLGCLLRPLIDEIPLVGAVQASFVDLPTIDFDLTGAANVADAPILGKTIRKVVERVISSMLVLPQRLLVPMNPNVSLEAMYYAPIGAVQIEVAQGRGFVAKKTLGIKRKPDVYVKTTFAGTTQRTATAKNECDPTFKAEGTPLYVLSDMEQKVEMLVYDQDIGKDDLIATISTTAGALVGASAAGVWLKPDEVLEKTAEGAEILVKATAYKLGEEGEPSACNGWQFATVLLERGKNLSGASKSWGEITVGNEVRKSAVVVSPEVPTPGFDPENPTWNLTCGVLVDSFSSAKVEVFDGKKSLGSVNFSGATKHEACSLSNSALPSASVTASLLLKPLVAMD